MDLSASPWSTLTLRFRPLLFYFIFRHHIGLYALAEHFLLCSRVTSPLFMVVSPIPGSVLPEMIVAIHCLRLLSCCWDKHHGQMQLWRGNGLFSAYSWQSIIEQSQGRMACRNWSRNCGGMLFPGSLLGLGSSSFIIQPGPPAEGWALQHQSSMKMPSHRQCHRPVSSRQLINWGFLFPGASRLCRSWQ